MLQTNNKHRQNITVKAIIMPGSEGQTEYFKKQRKEINN